MSAHWLWIAVAYPLFGALALLPRRAPGCHVSAFLRTAPLPALIAVIAAPLDVPMHIPWLQLGTHLQLDEITRLFLLFTSVLWLIAGWYAVRYIAHDPHRRRFAICFLFSLTGNIGLIVAADIPTFYTCFALMTFAAYGLVVHHQDETAFRAGRVYVAMAVIGEAMILTAILLIGFTGETLIIREAVAAVPGTPAEPLIIGLVLFGFGVKAGLLPMHGWLPLAHPVAPTPASAVLSGAMIKAGLLGWMLFLPGGHASYPHWGMAMILLGALGAFYAVGIGLTQSNPKTNLAYSSISQMGVMTICMGIGLSDAADWPTALLIAAIYALNHAFAKGALFMGVGVAAAEPSAPRIHRRIILWGLALAALAIAGAPMTGGALAKRALKYFAPSAHPVLGPTLDWILPLSALATTLLLARLVYMLYRRMKAPDRVPDDHPGLMPSWSANLLAVAFMAWLTIYHLQVPISTEAFSFADLIKSSVPILGGLLLAWLTWLYVKGDVKPWPAGDVVNGFERLAGLCAEAWMRYVAAPVEKRTYTLDPILRWFLHADKGDDPVIRSDARMRRFEISGTFFIALALLFIWSLWR